MISIQKICNFFCIFCPLRFESSKPIVKVLIGFDDNCCIIDTIKDESIPLDKKALLVHLK